MKVIYLGAFLSLFASSAFALTCTPPAGVTALCNQFSTPTYVPTKAQLQPAALQSAASVIQVYPGHAVANAAGVPTTGWDLPSVKVNFVRNMNYNWRYQPLYWNRTRAIFEDMDDVEIARMTMLYTQEGGNLQTLSDLIVLSVMNHINICGPRPCVDPALIALAQGVTAAHRLAAAIGPSLVLSSVNRLKPALLALYVSRNPPPIIKRSVAHYQSLGLNPKAGFKSMAIPGVNLDFTIYELYLDYRTGALALSPMSATLMTALWTKTLLGGAFVAGYKTGNGMLALWDKVSPGSSEWLASELGSALLDATLYQTIDIPNYDFIGGGCGCEITIDWNALTVLD